LASGIVNTAFMMGGALGLAILASLAAAQTNELLAAGATTQVALNGGYRVAFALGAVCAGVAAVLGSAFLRAKMPTGAPEHGASPAAVPAND
jgi:hypothetical protein